MFIKFKNDTGEIIFVPLKGCREIIINDGYIKFCFSPEKDNSNFYFEREIIHDVTKEEIQKIIEALSPITINDQTKQTVEIIDEKTTGVCEKCEAKFTYAKNHPLAPLTMCNKCYREIGKSNFVG